MDPLSIAGLILGILSAAGAVSSKVKQAKDTRLQNEYNEKIAKEEEKRQKDEIRKYNKETRKSAIARAINSRNVMMPKPKDYTPSPNPFSPNPVDVGGIIQGIGAAGQQITGGLSDMGVGQGAGSSWRSSNRDFIKKNKFVDTNFTGSDTYYG